MVDATRTQPETVQVRALEVTELLDFYGSIVSRQSKQAATKTTTFSILRFDAVRRSSVHCLLSFSSASFVNSFFLLVLFTV